MTRYMFIVAGTHAYALDIDLDPRGGKSRGQFRRIENWSAGSSLDGDPIPTLKYSVREELVADTENDVVTLAYACISAEGEVVLQRIDRDTGKPVNEAHP